MTARQKLSDMLQDRLAETTVTDPGVLAEYIVGLLEQATQGNLENWLLINGTVREVNVADRFGPASWEISTEYHPGDEESW